MRQMLEPLVIGMILLYLRMDKETIRERLLKLHATENEINRELSGLDKQIKTIEIKKKKLAKRVSHNMKYRNQLINKL